MEEKLSKIIAFSDKTFKSVADIEPLQHLIEEELELNEVTELVTRTIRRSDAFQIFSCLFLGLTHKPLSQKKRLKLIETIITTLGKEEESSRAALNILNILLLELDKLKTSYLVRLSNLCIEVIRDSEMCSKTSWKVILPKILSLLYEKKEVSYAGSEMNGTEFKKEIIKTICRINISAEVVVALAEMFREIPMANDEHEEVVNKFCEMFEKVQIENLPSLVRQLLSLCKDNHIVVVFLKLRRYFSKYLHSMNGEVNHEMSNEVKKQIAEAELTILIHIEDFARISRLSELMKLCKNASNASCLLLDPFLLSILLVLSCIPAYETQVTEILRILIVQAVNEEERKKESAWLCLIIESNFDIDQLFSKTIQSRLCDHDKVISGLVNLSFILLAVSGIKSKESTLKKVWRIGRIILVSLIKKHKKITKLVLQNLTDRIITGCISQQYTDCLLHLCNVASVTIVDNISIVIRILEFINSMPGIVSQRIVTALIPLVQISSNLRDNLIMCLRKALFSRNIEIRQTAVLGFLQLLKFLKLQKVSALSQNTLTQTTFYGPSVFTQICMDVHTQQTSSQQIRAPMNQNINEAICLEVIGILKRCFMQQASVKTTLYKGLFSAICANPQLCALVLDVLLDHFSQFYENDPNVLPPLIFEKTINVRNSEVTLQEPIGHLVLLVQDVLGKSRVVSITVENTDDEAVRSLFKFTDILNSLVDRFSNCDLSHFQLDEFTNMSNTSCDSQKTQEIVKQILSVYEALIAYVINTWSANSDPQIARKLTGLHAAYHRIVEFVKNVDKGVKKKDKDTSKDILKEEDFTVVETKKKRSKKDKNTGPKKCLFKMPPTILNLKTINRLLSLFLLEEVEWSSAAAVQEIKPRGRLFHYTMTCALDAVRQMKVRLNEEQKSSAVFNDMVSLTKLVFLRCLSRYEEISDFDATSAAISVECFSEITSLIVTHYKSKFSQFLQETVFVSSDEGLPKQLLPVLKVYKNLLKIVLISENKEETTETDIELDLLNHVLTPTLINAISVIILALPADHELTIKVLDWLVSIAEKHYFKLASNCKSFMNLVFTMLNRCKSELTLLDSLSVQLCHIFPPIVEANREKNIRPLMMVTEESKTGVLTMICTTLISQLDDADYMISRFKSENFIISYLESDEENSLTQCSVLKRREKELCQHVTHITLMAETLISIAAPTGPCLESLIKFLTRTFSLLTALAKYFMLRSTAAKPVYQNALFHKLVKIAGSQFIRQEASELILYVEKDYENENKKSLSHLKSQAKKQFILLPKLVSELESFPKAVMQLSKKCKDAALMNNVKLTITRDFRLNVKKVDELISRQNESDAEDEDSNMETPILSTRSSTEPSQKRRRTS